MFIHIDICIYIPECCFHKVRTLDTQRKISSYIDGVTSVKRGMEEVVSQADTQISEKGLNYEFFL